MFYRWGVEAIRLAIKRALARGAHKWELAYLYSSLDRCNRMRNQEDKRRERNDRRQD